MTSLNKLVASAFHGSQENTLALASVNFDFSLLKFEAPKEYAGFGDALSLKRRVEAEDGSAHVTARKLGALFEDGLPEVPKLFEAYGKRVTEIAKFEKVNPKGSNLNGPFADYVGADGTTIWAAATSGSGAIAVHLLACLLARVWKDSRAIAIWVELIERRKDVLQETVRTNSFFPRSALQASRIEVTREQLAKWDASVRAWVQTADRAKALQQHNVALLIKNLSLPVSTESEDVYASVNNTWTNAMTALELLLEGVPQRIQDGSLILALSAWHLYPDISVAGSSVLIKQHDTLVSRGGIITVGLQNKPDEEDEGIYWSLPLNHLRYYGKPVLEVARAGLGESRVTMDELRLVALGSILSMWQLPEMDFEEPARVILTLAASFPPVPALSWSRWLGRVCGSFLSSRGDERSQKTRLISFGFRRCRAFIARSEEHPPPIFGFSEISRILSLLGSAGEKIQFLQNWASKSRLDLSGSIIRYTQPGDATHKFTSLIPPKPTRKRTYAGGYVDKSPHWTKGGNIAHKAIGEQEEEEDLGNMSDECNRYSEQRDAGHPNIHYLPPTWNYGVELEPFVFLAGDSNTKIVLPLNKSKLLSRARALMTCHEVYKFLVESAQGFNLLYGPDSSIFFHRWANELNASHNAYYRSLRALDVAENIYKDLTAAFVDLEVTKSALHSASYIGDAYQGFHSPESVAFSCICFFESGGLNIDACDLKAAMAICHENSLFVARRMLLDPTDPNTNKATIQRLHGSVGQPGLAILIPPNAPEIRQPEHKSLRVINYAPFNGEYEDNFSSTSLHLRFTGSTLPASTALRHIGEIYRRAMFYETLVQVYDHGVWVGDVDVLAGHKKYKYGWGEILSDGRIARPLASVDNWDELLDEQPCATIVRACGNHLGRLAIASVLAQLRRNFRLIDQRKHAEYEPNYTSENAKSTKTPATLKERNRERTEGEELDREFSNMLESSRPTPDSDAEWSVDDTMTRGQSISSGGSEPEAGAFEYITYIC